MEVLNSDKSPERDTVSKISEYLDRSCTPTHVIVQRQLDDLILSQKAAADRSREETSLSLRDNFVSRDLYDQMLADLKLEREQKYVSRVEYDNIKRELEEEKLQSFKLKTELDDATEKLDCALGQVELLEKQLEREKSAYQKSFNLLKLKTIKESTKNVALETQNSEIAKEKEKQVDILENKEKEIQSLTEKIKAQDEVYKRQLGEMSVKLQQELYIAKTLGDKNKSKSEKPGKSNLPKSKS